jgi:hypothetical protein
MPKGNEAGFNGKSPRGFRGGFFSIQEAKVFSIRKARQRF